MQQRKNAVRQLKGWYGLQNDHDVFLGILPAQSAAQGELPLRR